MTSRPFWVPGALCWARDQERAFVEARIESVKDGEAMVSIISPEGDSAQCERRTGLADLLPRAEHQRCVAEMDDLQELNEASVLSNVELLFGRQQCAAPGQGPSTIYSSVGPVLIAMNPFTELPIYGEDWVEAYHRAGMDESAARNLGPHCYRTVEEAYCRLRHSRHQSVVICGESGAGKTVTNRKMLEYLCQVARRNMPNMPKIERRSPQRAPELACSTPPTRSFSSTAPESPPTGSAIHSSGPVGANPRQITEANVLLEAFGNATTTRNDNSSRFGKYTKLSFDNDSGYFTVCGCHVDHYLLERSRVCSQSKGERNYHVFYQLLRSGEGEKYGLVGGPEAFKYTRDGAKVGDFNDAEEFCSVRSAMTKACFDEAAITSAFQAVAAVLLLGNVEFAGNEDECRVTDSTRDVLDKACSLLGVDADRLSKGLCCQHMKVPGGSTIRKALGVDEAAAQRDTVAKTVYSRLFDDIVGFISSKLRRKRSRKSGSAGAAAHDEGHAIGLLDIFGFEDMATNGLEQLFINLTNERIQHLFNSIMFRREVEAYRKEGIESIFDAGVDNSECVRLFTSTSNPPGIVKLLSESCRMRAGRDGSSFVSELNSSFAQHPYFEVCGPQDAQRVAKAKGLKSGGHGKLALDYRECFQIRHYAGSVMYTVRGWRAKSIDALLPHLTEVLASSAKPKVKEFFEKEEGHGQTIGEKFCAQLENLAHTLEQGETLFVRCIKSNPQMVPGLVDRPFVLEQLVNGGVIAALEMRHRGLPERMDYESFCEEFDLLEHQANAGKEERTRCELLMREFFGARAEQDSEFAFGLTKVFMKSHLKAFLRAVLSLRTRNLVKAVQRKWRRFMGTQAITTVTAAWDQFEEASILAKGRGVHELPGVASALLNAENKIRPMLKLIDELRAKHGNDAYKIGTSLPVDKIGALHHVAETVEAVVKRVVERKDEADAIFGARMGAATNKLVKFAERVQALEAECAEVADEVEEAERQTFLQSCKVAGQRLEALRAKDFPELRALGPVGADLEGDTELKGSEICPRLAELLAEGEKLVIEAEKFGYEILRVKRMFQKAVQECQGKHDDAQARLEALQEPARRCRAEGLDGIVEKINDAWRKEMATQELLCAAKDADAFAAAVEAFAAAVREAEDTVEKGREALAKREAEKEERRELQQSLDQLQLKLTEQMESLRKSREVRLLGQDAGGVSDMTRDIEELRQKGLELRGGSGATLSEWRPRVEDFIRRARASLDKVEGAVSKVYKARQEEFSKRLNAFQKSPAMSTPDRPRVEDVDPEDFIRDGGHSMYEEDLLGIVSLFKRLKEAGMPRSAARQCVDNFFRHAWGGPPVPALNFTPQGRRLSFSPTSERNQE